MIVAALGDVPLIADADTGYGAGAQRCSHRAAVRRRRCRRDPVGGSGVSEAVWPSARQAGRRRGDVRTDAMRGLGRPSRRRHARGGAHRCPRAARARRRHRAGQPVRAGGRGHHLRRGAAGHRRDRADRSRSRRPAADQPGAGRHDPAGVVGAAAGTGIRDRDSPVESAGARHLRHAGRAVRTQRRQPRRLSRPRTPADFFNLVGMAEWRDLDEQLAGKEAVSWA